MERKVFILAILLASIGLYSELASLTGLHNFIEDGGTRRWLFSMLDIVLLRGFEWGYISSDVIVNNGNLNIYQFFFCLTMLIGCIFYIQSGWKESRILKFSFSILFLGSILVVLYIVYAYFIWRQTTLGFPAHLYKFIPLKLILILGISYYCLRILMKSNLADFIQEVPEEAEGISHVATSRKSRLFHLLMDFAVCFLLFKSSFIALIIFPIVEPIEIFSGSFVFVLMTIFYRMIYYSFFETIFQSTPAKFLTHSKVVLLPDQKPGFGVIFKRTLSRFVPFEPFSFLANADWHDKWTNTTVVKTSEEGYPSTYFVWIGLSYLGLIILGRIFL